MASAGTYASLITTPAPNHSVFTGRMPFLPPNQLRQSTEGTLQPHNAATELQLQLEVDDKSVGECLRPDARTGGRTTRKHNASGRGPSIERAKA